MLKFRHYNTINEVADAGLLYKSKKHNIPLDTLRKIYKRGVSSCKEEADSDKWGMARVNSYILNDTMDYDINEEHISFYTDIVEKLDEEKYLIMFDESPDEELHEACWDGYKQIGMKKKGKKKVPNCVPEELNPEELFDIIEVYVTELAISENIDIDELWDTLSDEELLEAAVDKKGFKSSTGGLTQKGRDHYNRETGGNLKAPVTTPPSKLKPGSKAYNRRKSFCARMSGVDGPMKKPNGEPTRKALALKKWNC